MYSNSPFICSGGIPIHARTPDENAPVNPLRRANASLIQLRGTNATSTLYSTLPPFRLWHSRCSRTLICLAPLSRRRNICLQRCRRGTRLGTRCRCRWLRSWNHELILILPACCRKMEVTRLAGYGVLVHVFVAILQCDIQGFFEESNVEVIACIYVH